MTITTRPTLSYPTVPFVFVDVFADRPLSGNPLAVVPDADRLDIAEMRGLAREFNQSETTFVLRPSRPDAQIRLRSFTPAGAEVGGAGHNALGAWLWLAYAGRFSSGRFCQEIGNDLLTVEVHVSDDGPARVIMQQSAPTFGPAIDPRGALAAALGIAAADFDPTLPTMAASTGVAHLLVALRDRTGVDRVDVDSRALLAVLRASGAEGCYVYSVTAEAHAYARFFNPTVGIVEDPATGTAAGPLAAALVRAGRAPDDSTVEIQQGHALGRPSRLVVEVSGETVRLSGSGLVTGIGQIAVGRAAVGRAAVGRIEI